MHTKFWLESLKERDNVEDLGVDGTTSERILKVVMAFVKMVMNLWVPQKVGNFLTSQITIIFSRMTQLMELVGWLVS